MKTSLNIALLLLLFLNQKAVAQKGAHFGFQTAITSAWILNQNNARTLEDYPEIARSELDYKLNFGWQFGGTAGYNFTHQWGVQIQPMFDKRGQKYEDDFSLGSGPLNVKRNIDLSYFAIPVLGKYTSKRSENIKAYVVAGPQFGFLLNASESVVLNDVPKIDNVEAERKFRAFDAGFALGSGVELYFKQHFYLHFGLNTYMGLTDINSDLISGFISKNDSDYKPSRNFVGGLSIGFHYLVSKRSTSAWKTPSFPLQNTGKKKHYKMD